VDSLINALITALTIYVYFFWNCMPSFINLLLVWVARRRIILYYREFHNRLHYFNIYLLFIHVDNVHWCCYVSTDVWVLMHRKETCGVLLHMSAAWSWRQHHDSDRCAAVFIISFVSTVLLSLRHVAECYMSWRMPMCGLPKVAYSRYDVPWKMSSTNNNNTLDWGHWNMCFSIQPESIYSTNKRTSYLA
jgi:hypothetical protein